MSQTAQTTSKIRVPSRKSMTPAKYKKLPPEMKRLYNQKARAENKAFDAMILKSRTAANEKTANALVDIVAQNPRLEHEIVHNWLTRHNYRVVDSDTGE